MTEHAAAVPRLPPWLKVAMPSGHNWKRVSGILQRKGLATVCDSARCPNKAECWASGTATFMVLGSVCTRFCRFCAVDHGTAGEALRSEEPAELARAVAELGLAYAVVTSVDRDDLADRGASHFAACAAAIKALVPGVRVELLVPDYREGELDLVLDARPDVLAHNVETVERLQVLRDKRASYAASLKTLALASARSRPQGGSPVVKSSIMLGLGEEHEEIFRTMDDLREAGCSSLVLGQYLRPSVRQAEVVRYLPPEEFRARRGGVFARLRFCRVRALGPHELPRGSCSRGARPRGSFRPARIRGFQLVVGRDFKVPGGKLLRIEVEAEAGIVLRAVVRGDFFAHPEEAFEAAEAELIGVPVDRLDKAALALFSRPPLRIFGASPTDIARALMETARDAQTR